MNMRRVSNMYVSSIAYVYAYSVAYYICVSFLHEPVTTIIKLIYCLFLATILDLGLMQNLNVVKIEQWSFNLE